MAARPLLSLRPAFAYQPTVFARVADGTVEITAIFADGCNVTFDIPQIRDVDDMLLLNMDVDVAWPAIFRAGSRADRLRISVDAGNGQGSDRVLTPNGLAGDQINSTMKHIKKAAMKPSPPFMFTRMSVP